MTFGGLGNPAIAINRCNLVFRRCDAAIRVDGCPPTQGACSRLSGIFDPTQNGFVSTHACQLRAGPVRR